MGGGKYATCCNLMVLFLCFGICGISDGYGRFYLLDLFLRKLDWRFYNVEKLKQMQCLLSFFSEKGLSPQRLKT